MNKSRLLFLLSFVNVIAVFVCICYLPDVVAYRFNSAFLIDEMASKWWNIILPVLQLISCIILIVIDVKTLDIKHFYRYIVMYVAIDIAMFYTWLMIVIQFGNYQIGDKLTLPVSTMVFVAFGLFMMAYAFYQGGKAYRSFSIFSFSWTRKNPIVWSKTLNCASVMGRFVGLLIMACGIVNDICFGSNWVYLVAFGIWFVLYYIITFLHSIRMNLYYN